MPRSAYNPNSVTDLPLFGGSPVPSPTYDSDAAAKARDAAITALRRSSGEDFIAAAADFMLSQLKTVGPQTSEQLVDACKAAGIRAHDDRAFGPPIARLSRRGLIVRVGEAMRSKGHGATGGNRWAAK